MRSHILNPAGPSAARSPRVQNRGPRFYSGCYYSVVDYICSIVNVQYSIVYDHAIDYITSPSVPPGGQPGGAGAAEK